MGSGKRGARRVQPALEGLEDRKLLNARTIGPNGKPINDKDLRHLILQRQNDVPVTDRRLLYTTPEGSHVVVTLYGLGTLEGSSVRPDGTLDLVYDNTTSDSKIVAYVRGGTGQAPLGSLRDADVPTAASASVTGSDALNTVHLRSLNLISGGAINLMGGVNNLFLRSLGANSQVHAAALPSSVSTALRTPVSPTASSANNSSSASSGATVVNGQLVVTNTGTTGGGSNTVTINPTYTAPGLVFQVATRAGGASLGTPPVGDPQIFGYDATTDQLLRFDATTGALLQSIPVPAASPGAPIAGVGLGRNNGQLVALVGVGSNIYVYDAISGNPVGSFSTSSLAADGLTRIDGIGSTDTKTIVTDSSAGAFGLAQAINVTASLAARQAVAVGTTFAPQREFELSGGVTGLPGSDTVYASGAAHFDTFQPDLTQVGVLAFNASGNTLRETARVAVPGVGTTYVNAGPPGTVSANPIAALGSVNSQLALDTGVVAGKNVVNLLTPTTTAATSTTPATTTLTSTGTLLLDSTDRLAGLSESFHPEIAGAALVNVTGILKRFTATTSQGLVVNDNGSTNLVAIHDATDTTIIGRPLLHVAIPIRRNVQLISTAARPDGAPNGDGIVTKVTTAATGPLSLP